MGSDGYTATEVADDEVEVLIACAMVLGIAAGNGLLVERMPDAVARQQRRTRNLGLGSQLIDHTGVGHETRATDLLGNLVSDDAALVAGVLVEGLALVLDHLIIDTEDTRLDRLGKSATADDGVELHGKTMLLHLCDDQILAHLILVGDTLILLQLLAGVVDGCFKDQVLVVGNGNLRRSRTRIDG